ncbi:MAG: hypothetical protein WBE26_05180, partial [Phycisphaerae bacterium]
MGCEDIEAYVIRPALSSDRMPERVAIGKAVKRRFQAEAKKRQQEHEKTAPGKKANTGGKLPQVKEKARDRTAGYAGLSYKTFEKAEEIVEAARAEPEKFAQQQQRSRDAVIWWLNRLGWTQKAIADQLGISRPLVTEKMSEISELIKLTFDQSSRGRTVVEIAESEGLPEKLVKASAAAASKRLRPGDDRYSGHRRRTIARAVCPRRTPSVSWFRAVRTRCHHRALQITQQNRRFFRVTTKTLSHSMHRRDGLADLTSDRRYRIR